MPAFSWMQTIDPNGTVKYLTMDELSDALGQSGENGIDVVGAVITDLDLGEDSLIYSETDTRYATPSDISTALVGKANTANHYTKTESDARYATPANITSAVSTKANSADVYSKIEADSTFSTPTSVASAITSKADVSSVYTKSESDGKYATPANITTAISGKADTSAMTSADNLRVLKAGDTLTGNLIFTAGNGIVLKSPDGTDFLLTVADDGTLSAETVA